MLRPQSIIVVMRVFDENLFSLLAMNTPIVIIPRYAYTLNTEINKTVDNSKIKKMIIVRDAAKKLSLFSLAQINFHMHSKISHVFHFALE